MDNWVSIIIAILTGLATAIPLVIQLIKYVQKAVQEKNWGQLLKLVQNLMEVAEEKFDNGADRKEWVLMSIKASADTINYNISMDEVSALIDSLAEMTNKINVKKVVEAALVEEVKGPVAEE